MESMPGMWDTMPCCIGSGPRRLCREEDDSYGDKSRLIDGEQQEARVSIVDPEAKAENAEDSRSRPGLADNDGELATKWLLSRQMQLEGSFLTPARDGKWASIQC
jgi:hypothetical protein